MKKTLSTRIDAMQQRMAANTAVARSRAYQAATRKREEASIASAPAAPAGDGDRPAAPADRESDQPSRPPRASARKPR